MIDMHAEGVGTVSALLEQVAHRAMNPEPAFDAVTDKLIAAEKRLFDSNTRLKPLKGSTIKRKARSKDAHTRAHADDPLSATGKLERFLTTKGPGAQPAKMSKNELLFGVPGGRHDLHYARYQAKHGRNPLVSAAVVRRAAGDALATHLLHAESRV